MRSSIKVTVKKFRDLTAEEVQHWHHIQEINSTLHSPYYSPDYCELVSAVLPNTEIALIESQGHLAFLPYQRDPGGKAMPLGYYMTDYQGAIAHPDHVFDPLEVIGKASLNLYYFNHVPVTHRNFQPFFEPEIEGSPIIDFSAGYGSVLHILRQKISRYINKISRVLEPPQFIFASLNEAYLAQLIEWKTAQYLSTGKINIFKKTWPRELLFNVLHQDRKPFRGVLSVLLVNNQLISAHLGMIYKDVYHWWFPAYDPAFEEYSPGSLLVYHICQFAEKEGIQKLDFGKGSEPYKKRFSNARIDLGWGYVDSLVFRKSFRAMKRWLKQSLKGLAKGLKRSRESAHLSN
jgi:CelD/BcsL family acetyltransferase involved in cellulose biosynthesis